MDSCPTFTLVVIPAKAGIHFGQRIPKLELRNGSFWEMGCLGTQHGHEA